MIYDDFGAIEMRLYTNVEAYAEHVCMFKGSLKCLAHMSHKHFDSL